MIWWKKKELTPSRSLKIKSLDTFMRMGVCLYVCTIFVQMSVGEKRVSDSSELELQVLLRHQVDARI